MSISKLFRPFKQKLLLEGVLRALLTSFMLGAATVFCISLIFHIKITKTPVTLVCLIGAGVVAVTFFLSFFLFYYPKQKKVARRIDEIGLQERVSTMLEYRNSTEEIAQIQRVDAVQKIQTVTAKQLKLSIRKAEVICCAVCLSLAVSMIFLPYDVFAFSKEDTLQSAEQTQRIKDLIERLREEVKESALNEELKESLNEIVDQLEEDLNNSVSELEQAARIEQAKEKMQELLEKAITKYKIGEALQMYELTRELGEAISEGNTEKVSAALDSLQAALTEDTSLVQKLSETLVNALADSGVESTDSLYTALQTFSDTLASIDITGDSFEFLLTAAFDTAESAIIAALEQQASIESEKEKLEQSMDEAKDEALGNEKPEGENEGEKPEGEMPEGERPEGEMPEGEMPEGEMPEGEMPEGEMPEGMGDGEDSGSTMTEGIYDPISGSVSYGEVFAAYYAEYLAALEDGTVPEDLQEIIDNYYSSLN